MTFLVLHTAETRQKLEIAVSQAASVAQTYNYLLTRLDRKRSRCPNGLVFGTPGSDKSMSCKREITFIILMTQDNVIICDPEDEYSPLVKRLGGQVIRLSLSSTDYVNPLDINLNYLPSWKSIGRMCRSFGTSPHSRRRRFLRKQDLKPSPSSPAASRASPSPPQESGGALRMNATCGRRCAALLPNCGPVGCLGKMLLVSSIWGSTKRSLTWQKRDTLFSHSYFRLAASAHGMSASELFSSRLMFPTLFAFKWRF